MLSSEDTNNFENDLHLARYDYVVENRYSGRSCEVNDNINIRGKLKDTSTFIMYKSNLQ